MPSSKSPSKHIAAILAIFAIICLAAALALSGCGEKKPSADKYATGEIYTFSGYIKEAKEYEIRSHDESPSEGRTHYSIIIDTVEEMPDGTHRYENDAQNSYSTVEEYAGDPNKLVYSVAQSAPPDSPESAGGECARIERTEGSIMRRPGVPRLHRFAFQSLRCYNRQ